MTLLIFLAAIAVWGVLHHQQRRHAAELSAECARHGLHVPGPGPAVPALESMLTMVVGFALVVPSVVVLGGAFASGHANQWAPIGQIVTLGMAAGVALLTLGVRSLAALKRESEMQRPPVGLEPPKTP